jgi:hypothetical protein
VCCERWSTLSVLYVIYFFPTCVYAPLSPLKGQLTLLSHFEVTSFLGAGRVCCGLEKGWILANLPLSQVPHGRIWFSPHFSKLGLFSGSQQARRAFFRVHSLRHIISRPFPWNSRLLIFCIRGLIHCKYQGPMFIHEELLRGLPSSNFTSADLFSEAYIHTWRTTQGPV